MRNLKLILPAAIVASGFLFCTSVSYGKAEYMQKEKLKSCKSCHSALPAKKDNLNDLGTCYSKNDHSLAKCKVPDGEKK